jgi:hypothetical protein
MITCLAVVSALLVLASVSSSVFDLIAARRALTLCAQTSVSDEALIFSKEYGAELEGFVPFKSIGDGFGLVGFMYSQSLIYVSLNVPLDSTIGQGSDSVIQSSYCDDCKVYERLHLMENQIIDKISTSIQALKAVYPLFNITITGSSTGGPLASLVALRLVQQGVEGVQMITFGAPPVGNDAMVRFSLERIPSFVRVLSGFDLTRPSHGDGQEILPSGLIRLWPPAYRIHFTFGVDPSAQTDALAESSEPSTDLVESDPGQVSKYVPYESHNPSLREQRFWPPVIRIPIHFNADHSFAFGFAVQPELTPPQDATVSTPSEGLGVNEMVSVDTEEIANVGKEEDAQTRWLPQTWRETQTRW